MLIVPGALWTILMHVDRSHSSCKQCLRRPHGQFIMRSPRLRCGSIIFIMFTCSASDSYDHDMRDLGETIGRANFPVVSRGIEMFNM